MENEFKQGQLVVLTGRAYAGCGLTIRFTGNVVEVTDAEPDPDGDIAIQSYHGKIAYTKPDRVRPLARGYETINGRKFYEERKSFK